MICNQCPRKCGPGNSQYPSFSSSDPFHYCGKTGDDFFLDVAKIMVHNWEEPCISGDRGSGSVFFSGCNLGCVFCQNYEISRHDNPKGKRVRADELEEDIYQLAKNGCHNINFLTGTHLIYKLLPLMKRLKERLNKSEYKLPFVWNSSAYETISQIKLLENQIDIYLPDLKYFSSELSKNLCDAPDYFDFASKAILEMVKQKQTNIYSDDNTILSEGVMIRHLVLPGFYKDSIKIIEWIEANLSNKTKLSILSQYIPDFYKKNISNDCNNNSIKNKYSYSASLSRKLTVFEYDKVVNRAIMLGFSDVYIQEKGCAKIDFVPIF